LISSHGLCQTKQVGHGSRAKTSVFQSSGELFLNYGVTSIAVPGNPDYEAADRDTSNKPETRAESLILRFGSLLLLFRGAAEAIGLGISSPRLKEIMSSRIFERIRAQSAQVRPGRS
jgi:hypothetical protein